MKYDQGDVFPFEWTPRMTSEKLEWCEDCKSSHTKSFGDQFHMRILAPSPAAQMLPWIELDERGFPKRTGGPGGMFTPTLTGWSGGDGFSGDGQDKLNVDDIVTLSDVYEPRPWWKFWLWGTPRKPQQFKVVRINTLHHDEVELDPYRHLNGDQ
jgi:hypothetical protein